jgi:hypothetical protein
VAGTPRHYGRENPAKEPLSLFEAGLFVIRDNKVFTAATLNTEFDGR